MLVSLVVFILCVVSVESLQLGGQAVEQCGIEASSHLVHHSPWLALLQYFHRGHLTRARCGATLITATHLLTAAHCVNKPVYTYMKARLGEYDVEAGGECVQGVCTERVHDVLVLHAAVHPGYDYMQHDIAVLTLRTPAPYTDFIRPACLPTGQLRPETTFIAAGWGLIPFTGEYSRVKKIIPLPFVDEQQCQKAYKSTVLPKNKICAGGEPEFDTCSGDSGGPLAWVKDRIEVWGVISSGNVHCGLKGYPGIYTSVIDHLDWIQDVIS